MESPDRSSDHVPPRSNAVSRPIAPARLAVATKPAIKFNPSQITIDVTWTAPARRALQSEIGDSTQDKGVRDWNNALRRAVRAVCLQVPPRFAVASQMWNFSAMFVSDAQMSEMNGRFRQKNRPTDVLSFAQSENALEFPSDFESDSEAPHLWGDLVIAVETTARQARERNHSNLIEVLFLSIHGTLHLFGYDHARDSQRRTMFRLQESVFEELKKS